tara:strand:- start:16272 stop:18047 length:1776 start_codon:yes stop_codon:yes gene_type:complete
MKVGHIISIVLISILIGIASNLSYTYLTTERLSNDEKTFIKLLEDDWENTLQENPFFASLLGDERFNDQVTSNSVEKFKLDQDYEISFLEKLSQINLSNLTEPQKLNYRLIKTSYEVALDGKNFPNYYMQLNQRGGVQDYYSYADRLDFSEKQDYLDWFERIKGFNQNIKNSLKNNQEGLKNGYTQPKLVSRAVATQIENMLALDIDKHPYFKAFSSADKVMSEQEANELKESVKEFIVDKLNPSYRKLLTFLRNVYIPNSRNSVGLDGVPNGKAWYEYLAKYHTTTNLTPNEIHEIGLKEVARIRSEMEDIIESVSWQGDFRSFLTFLRTDPQFYYETGEELLEAYRAMSKKIDAYMPSLFNKLPRAPYGVIPIPMETAPYTTTAYYNAPSKGRPGYYYANLYKPETRPKYEIPVLSVHEAVPGHHHQIALAQELENVPKFRNHLSFTSFVEGWGLYSEQLGENMGLYEDPYDKFGQLTYDMWRAIRLVVDTGMHYKGWTREEAVDLFLENTAKTPLDINNEVDRYIAWPGQALAYKIGQLKIMELRDKAKEELGEKFDLKDYHDFILSFGSIPMNILEEKVNEFIESKK